jgi:hypothetical protein
MQLDRLNRLIDKYESADNVALLEYVKAEIEELYVEDRTTLQQLSSAIRSVENAKYTLDSLQEVLQEEFDKEESKCRKKAAGSKK